jgi:VanZ family protein
VSQRLTERVPAGIGQRALTVVLVLTVVLQLVVLYDPNPSGVPAFPGLDKIVHATVFALPTLVGLLASAGRAWVIPALMVAHAPLSEVVQATMLPERSGDPMDAVADLVGVALGVLIGTLVRRARGHRVAVDAADA